MELRNNKGAFIKGCKMTYPKYTKKEFAWICKQAAFRMTYWTLEEFKKIVGFFFWK